MKEFKGTPGPWFRDNGRAIGPKSTEDDQSYGMVIPVGWVEFDPEIEVQVANQNIMAAAPELLEALQLLMAEQTGVNKSCGHNGFTCTCPYDKARSAIAKALGESQ